MNQVVSIITPSFNRANLVGETAASIVAQTYPYWEWVIVDDGSTDNSWEFLQSIAQKDSRIKIYQRDRLPKGACTCRNLAVEKCSGSFVLFLDTDDVLAPFCLEQRVKAALQQPTCDFIIFSMLLFKKELNDMNLLWNIDKDKDELMRMLINDPICQGTGTLWKKSSFQKVGMWREDLKIWQDVELHMRSFLWPVKYCKRMDLRPDVYLRISDDSLSRVGYHILAKVKSRIEVYKYACNAILEKNLLPTYKKGLREMGYEIMVGMIFHRHFEAGLLFLKELKRLRLFEKKELRDIKFFLFVHKYRIYVFKPLGYYFYDKIKEIAPKTPDSVATIAYVQQTSQFNRHSISSC